MGETHVDIEAIIRGLEDPNLELKETMPGRSDLAKTICAFANGHGGRLLVGIRNDPREVVGLIEDELFDFEQRITHIIRDRIEPIIAPKFSIRNHGKNNILQVRIFPGNQTPYFLQNRGKEEGTYIRIGSSNQKADAPTIQELERRRLNISYDSTPFHPLQPNAIMEQRVQYYMDRRKKIRSQPHDVIESDLLISLGALVDDNGRHFPTVGGVLLFSTQPTDHFPDAKIRCARFRGITIDEFIDEKEVIGTLDQQIDQAFQFYKTHTARGSKVKELYREERDAYPTEAVREALVNAVCHRDYTINGAEVRLAIFDDRIEISNPGTLPVGITLESIGTGISRVRNPVVARIFRDLGLIEQWGRGITKIRERMRDWELPEPEFRELGRNFKVILRLKPTEPVASAVPQLDKIMKDSDARKVIEYLREHGQIKAKDVLEITGKARSYMHRKLKKWETAGLIEWRGANRNDPTGFYVLVKE